MSLLQPAVGAGVLVVATLAVAVAWFVRRSSGASADVPAASLDRVRALPGFATLVRAETRHRTAEVACLVLAVLGVALLSARWVGIDDDAEEMRNRDVVLCMDVSGSMQPVVDDVLTTWTRLTHTLDGERLALVMFDGNAVTSFPLTDDYDYVRAALERARVELADGDLAGTRAERSGSSLIGDGLASCATHFDRRDEKRSRTVVLATDNLVSGDAVYTLAQATDVAMENGVMVYGVVPTGNTPVATDELRTETARTGGDVLVLDPTSDTTSVVIAEAVTSQQKSVILTEARQRSYDRVAPGALLVVVGLLGASLTRRSPSHRAGVRR
ncbi:vWA domain-containing protein [Nocardioides yefusunii]|uniref:VWA domain-containing protein n=1 Tax=Nocardioides yefusunii TaxID=2500546 RepID=A0ABW1QSN7_9ACTN|nr:VWA domain-containing protein [Nocardioides yefusunii]